MSVSLDTSSGGLPIVNQAREPRWVRDGSPATQKSYERALAFEDTLVEQLARSLTASSGLGGESSQEGEGGGEEGSSPMSSAGESQLSSMLPQALTSSVMNAGGLGLAAQMTRDAQSFAPASASGGTGPS
ncbi:MAG TPA: hypothetical protein VK272_10845 [Solirubrobacteraceae bacterium]|nr:hypothetical protein [Solirubrobacteraceae bacterium]